MMTGSQLAFLMGGIITAIGAPALLKPESALGFYRKLYRHSPTGWALTTLALLWFGWLLLITNWGGLEPYKKFTFLLIPLSIAAVCYYMEELLMPRALGGLFLLIPAPILDAFRFHESVCRYLPIVFVYLLTIAGFALVLNPYVYRIALDKTGATPSRFRLTGVLIAGLGLTLIAMGLIAF